MSKTPLVLIAMLSCFGSQAGQDDPERQCLVCSVGFDHSAR